MPGAGQSFNHTVRREATAEFSYELTMLDGSDFPWAEYELVCLVGDTDAPRATLSVGDGLAVDQSDDLLTISLAPRRLCEGAHPYVCLATHTTTGKVVPLFDGTITITGDDS